LVSNEGRVVLLDFGLATKFGAPEPTGTMQIVGTPRYMSPEHAAGNPISEASDWYSVGVMVYEALTGLPPFSGPLLRVLQAKQEVEPTPPNGLVHGIPDDLDALCRNLLRREPAMRLTGSEVLTRLGAASPASETIVQRTPASDSSTFVGRVGQLAVLKEAFETMKGGQTVAVQVHGGSGMGKTALVTNFLDGLRTTEPEAVLLTGRCYEHEAVPYKALDSLVDALSQHLRQLPDGLVKSLLPRGVWALGRVFAALLRVDRVAQAPRPMRETYDAQELRRRAFSALRELVGRVAERSALVLFIDDLQWGDIDSAAVLSELLRPPDPPPFMLIICYRSEDAATSPLLRRLLPLQDFVGAATEVRELEVNQLALEDARSLALTLMDTSESSRADDIARESGGSPLFIDQLVQYSRLGKPQGTLETMLQTRVSELGTGARQLLEAVAVAGRPLDVRVARQAADLGSEDPDAIMALRAAHFVRTRATAAEGRSEIEPYHDRIRETVVASLSAAARARQHHRLAAALEAFGHTDPEALAVHWQGAGDPARAARYALDAAQEATDALAFDRAARLYRLVLDLQPADSPQRHQLWAKLGDALANAGRVIEAARSYLAARDGATAIARLDFERLAAEQFLMGGHLDEGVALLRSVLDAVGMKLPSTPRRALLSLLITLPYVRLRGVRFRERPEYEISAEELQRVDICYSVCRGLGFIDPIGAIAFQARHLLRALSVGEPYRVVRALAFQATAEATHRRGRQRAERLLQRARELAERIQDPRALGLCWSTRGLVDLMSGRWQRSWEALRRAEGIFRERCATHSYDIVVSHIHGLNALSYAGEFREYFRWVPEFLNESRNRGDLYAETNLRLHDACRKCFQEDDPAGALDEVRTAMAHWTQRRMSMERSTELLRQAEFLLYEGRASLAWELVNSQWSSLAPLLLFRIEIWVVAALFLRARVALAMAVASSDQGATRDHFLNLAEEDAARIERAGTHWGAPLALLIRASVASERGREDLAVPLLITSHAGFRGVDMALHAAVAARQRGALMGGEGGRTLIAEADEWMIGQGIKDPSRMSSMIAPARWNLIG
jgi:hypothetical protein